MISFKIKEIAKSTLSDRKHGKEVREKIRQIIQEHNKIEIDMQNTTDFTPSFLEEAIVMLPIELGKEEFKKSVILKNIDPAVKGLMNSMLTNKLKLIERYKK